MATTVDVGVVDDDVPSPLINLPCLHELKSSAVAAQTG
jgi:hypothetical protein